MIILTNSTQTPRDNLEMNLSFIFKCCSEWSPDEWDMAFKNQKLYKNVTLKEYQELVKSNHNKIKECDAPMPEEALRQWERGRKNLINYINHGERNDTTD